MINMISVINAISMRPDGTAAPGPPVGSSPPGTWGGAAGPRMDEAPCEILCLMDDNGAAKSSSSSTALILAANYSWHYWDV